MARAYNTRTERIKIALTAQEKLNFEKAAKQLGVSVSQLCRTLVKGNKDREINETAIAINSVKEMVDKQMLEFAKANDIATSFLINNLSNLYENKLEKLQEKVDSMAPYFVEAQRIIAAREAVLRKQRAAKRAKS